MHIKEIKILTVNIIKKINTVGRKYTFSTTPYYYT